MIVRDVMKGEVLSISPVARLQDALQVLSQRNIQYIVVMAGTDIQGILSASDLDRFSKEERNDISISEIMNRTATCVSVSAGLEEAAELIRQSRLAALPVCQNGTLVGIITMSNLEEFFKK